MLGDSKGALIGAAVAGTAAAAYGTYVDNLEAELRKIMAGSGVPETSDGRAQNRRVEIKLMPRQVGNTEHNI